MARVTLENISKYYPNTDKPAVDGIDLDIQDREFIVLVGPSGCGKSTSLRMIAGLEEISDGTIKIGDRIVNDVPPKDRDIAMVFQNYALYPHMTVYENMAFGLKLRRRELGLSKQDIDTRVREAAQTLGITPYLDRKPKALSGGQRQRVAVGRAIVRNPKAFLFDEPLSNLDAKLRVETRAEIKKLHLRLQTTTIYVTHDQEEAMTLGDRIVVMKEGTIHQCAPPLEVYDRPVNRFVAGFVGTPPMNFMKVKIQPSLYITFANQKVRLPERLARIGVYVGKEMVLGVRPESLSPGNSGKFAGIENSLSGKVVIVEPLGDKVDLYLTLGDGQAQAMDKLLVCRADAHEFGKIRANDIITLFVDLSRVHVFESGDNGMNVSLSQESGHAAA